MRYALLAVAFVLVGSCEVRAAPPTYVLRAGWPDGTAERIPAVDAATCYKAKGALLSGVWIPLGREGTQPTEVACAPGNAFKKNWECIKGFNCGK